MCQKFAYFLRNLETSRANNSRILMIKVKKFSGSCFYLNTNIYGNFQMYISVPLTNAESHNLKFSLAIRQWNLTEKTVDKINVMVVANCSW